MKNILVTFLLCLSFSAFAQTKQDTLINTEVQAGSGNYIPKKALNPVLHEILGNRVTNYGSTPVMTPDSIFYANVKVKFGNSAEITVSGHIAIVAPDADPVNYRVDYLVVNRNGTVQVVTGSPGVAGLSPNIDANNQVMVYWWVINNTGIGTVTPVTYATLPQTRAGVATNLSINPYTFITVTQEMIDDALAGIVTGGGGSGHTLKNNGTTLTQRGILQVLSDATIMRDSSATISSILDLRNYLPMTGSTRTWGGTYRVASDGLILETNPADPLGGTYTTHYGGIWSANSYATSLGVNTFGNLAITPGATDVTAGNNTSQIQTQLQVRPSEIVIEADNDNWARTKGIRYAHRYFTADSANANTTWDYRLPDVKFVKDWVSAHGGGGGDGTTSPLTTKGDIWAYSTTNARFPVGTDGYLLTANSGASTGLEWVAAPFVNTQTANTVSEVFTLESSNWNGSDVPGSRITVANAGLHLGAATINADASDLSVADNAIQTQVYDYETTPHQTVFKVQKNQVTINSTLGAGINTDFTGLVGAHYYAPGTDNTYVQRKYVTDQIAAISGGTTTNALSAGTGLEYITGTTFNGSAARTLRLATGAAAANLGFTPVANTVTVNGHALSSNVTVTASDVGLGSVDNTSDATKNSATATLSNKTLTSPVINSGILGSSTVANTQSAGDNSTKVANTAYVDAAVTAIGAVSAASTTTFSNKTINGASNTLSNIAESSVTNLVSDLAAKQATLTASSLSAFIHNQSFTATASQTVFTLSTTVTSTLIVVVSGVVAKAADYTATGTTLTLTTGALVGEVVQIIYL